jgi:hypothetical protein
MPTRCTTVEGLQRNKLKPSEGVGTRRRQRVLLIALQSRQVSRDRSTLQILEDSYEMLIVDLLKHPIIEGNLFLLNLDAKSDGIGKAVHLGRFPYVWILGNFKLIALEQTHKCSDVLCFRATDVGKRPQGSRQISNEWKWPPAMS